MEGSVDLTSTILESRLVGRVAVGRAGGAWSGVFLGVVGMGRAKQTTREAVFECDVFAPYDIDFMHDRTSRWLDELSDPALFHWCPRAVEGIVTQMLFGTIRGGTRWGRLWAGIRHGIRPEGERDLREEADAWMRDSWRALPVSRYRVPRDENCGPQILGRVPKPHAIAELERVLYSLLLAIARGEVEARDGAGRIRERVFLGTDWPAVQAISFDQAEALESVAAWFSSASLRLAQHDDRVSSDDVVVFANELACDGPRWVNSGWPAEIRRVLAGRIGKV